MTLDNTTTIELAIALGGIVGYMIGSFVCYRTMRMEYRRRDKNFENGLCFMIEGRAYHLTKMPGLNDPDKLLRG